MSGKVSGYQKFFQDARKQQSLSMTPEQQVLRHLAEQSNKKRKQKRSRRRPPPFFAILLLVISLAAGALGVISPNVFDSTESVDQVLASLNVPFRISSLANFKLGFFGNALAADPKNDPKADHKIEKKTGKTDSKTAPKNDGKPETKSESKPESKSDAAKKSAGAADSAGDKRSGEGISSSTKKEEANPDIKSWTSEEMSFFKRLNDRKIELDRREAELAKLEEELQKQRVGIEDKIKSLEKTRADISATLKGRVEQDQEKVTKLVDVYSSMKPTTASKVIESLNEDLAVAVLDKMKKKNAAEILNTMSGPKAKKLSEMLTGYRQPASAAKAE